MVYIASCLKGLEFIAEKETNGKKIYTGKVLYSKDKKLRSCEYSYELYDYFTFKNLDEIIEKAKKIKFDIKGSFKVECIREGEHEFKAADVEYSIGDLIENKCDLKNPENVIVVDIKDYYCFIGKNLTKYKRGYRIRTSTDCINEEVAFALLDIAEFKEKDFLFDPRCKDGTLLLEAFELKGKNLFGMDEDVKNASINTRIKKANIKLEQGNFDWIDTKFKPKYFDKIITKLASTSKKKSERLVNELLNEFLKQAQIVLKKKGVIVVLLQKDELFKEALKNYKFKILDEYEILWGVKYKILKLGFSK